MLRKLLGALTGCAMLIACTGASMAGVCISATTENNVMTPKGATHAPGTIEICVSRRMASRVAVLAISIDGERVGNFMSRTETLDRVGLGSFIQFRRLNPDEVILEGFTIRRGSSLEGFRMQTRIDGKRPFYPELVIDDDGDDDDLIRHGLGTNVISTAR